MRAASENPPPAKNRTTSVIIRPMLTPEQIENRLDRILLKVEKPGRYVGGELNIAVKDWDEVQTRVALVFPDIYDIGVSNVGLKILYDQVNQRPDALAERAYAPWTRHGSADARTRHPAVLARIEAPAGRVRPDRLFPALRDALHQRAQHPRPGRHPGPFGGPRRVRTRSSSPADTPPRTPSRCTPSSTPS